MNVWKPRLEPQIVSKGVREGSNIRDECSREQCVTNHGKLLLLERNDVVLPSDIFVGKTIDETVSKVERLLQVSCSGDDGFFLGLSFSELCLKFVHLSDNASDSLLDNSKFFKLLFSFFLRGLSFKLQGLDHDVDIVILDDINDPISQVSGC